MITHMPKEMIDPISLKTAYGLTYIQLSEALGITPRAAEYYGQGKNIKTSTKILCGFLHKEWQARGLPCNLKYLKIEQYY